MKKSSKTKTRHSGHDFNIDIAGKVLNHDVALTEAVEIHIKEKADKKVTGKIILYNSEPLFKKIELLKQNKYIHYSGVTNDGILFIIKLIKVKITEIEYIDEIDGLSPEIIIFFKAKRIKDK